jgi:phage-related protein
MVNLGGFASGAAGGAVVNVVIRGVDKLSGTIDRASSKLGKFGQFAGVALKGLVVGAGLAATALTGIGAAAIKAGSDLEESINAVEVVFGEGADTVLEFGQTAARSVGLATNEFNQLATVTGALLKDVGLPMEEVGDLTNDLTIRAADMASVFNTDVKDALSAINQALRGETEAIRRYAGDVTEATLEQFRLAEGISTSVTEMSEQEKRLLRLQLIMKQTETFAGDFANTQDSVANRMRIMKAEMTDTVAKMGTELQPAFQNLLTVVSEELIPALEPLIPLIGKAIKKAIEVVTIGISKFATFITENKDEISAFFTGLVEVFKTLWTVLKPIVKLLGEIFKLIVKIVTKIAESKFGQALGGAVKFGAKLVGLGAETVASGVSGVSEKFGDFIQRPGQNATRFSPQDTVIGVKNPNALGGGMTVNIGVVQGTDPNDLSNALQQKLRTVITQ